jgi:hypothetical protein
LNSDLKSNVRNIIARYLSFLFENHQDFLEQLSPLYNHFVDDEQEDDYCNDSSPCAYKDPVCVSMKDHIPAFFVNARSLCNKMSLLRSYVNEYSPLVVCITESWGNDGVDDAFFSLPSFTLYRCDRQNSVGGGVLIYVSDTLPSVLVSRFSLDGSEAVACRITLSPKTHHSDLILCCVYRPPSYDLRESRLLDYISGVVSTSSKFFVLCGDFNCPEIHWPGCKKAPVQSLPLVNWSLNHFLIQYVSAPTRPASQTVLDLIFTSVSTPVSEVKINECFGTSDHALITFNILTPFTPFVNHCKLPMYSMAKWRLYLRVLINSRWPISGKFTVSEAWTIFRSNILHAAASAIPVKVKQSWKAINSAKVRTAVRAHRRAYAALEQHPSFVNRLKLQISRKKINATIYVETCKHEAHLARVLRCDPKPFWSYVKSNTLSRSPISAVRNNNDELVNDSGTIAECFSNMFSSIFKADCQSIADVSTSEYCDKSIANIIFTPYDVYTILQSLPSATSNDHDNLCYLLLKKGGFFLASKLSDLFNFSMQCASYPDSWRTVRVTPVFKSGKRDLCSNYRPIAITSCVSRVMERIIVKQMMNFFMMNNVIRPTQHGFLPKRSVETAGLVHLDFLTNVLDRGMTADVLFLDFSKAFDTVPHTRLMHKLYQYGIKGTLFNWISNYLSNRNMTVIVNGSLSPPAPILSGVIQGSVLGPILFSIYVNDIDLCISSANIVKYADDIKLSVSIPKTHDLYTNVIRDLQLDLTNVSSWSIQNGLSLNTTKCKVMHFGSANPCYDYLLNDITLDHVSSFKDLGVTISNTCSFNEHISCVVAKANRILGIIKKTFVSRNVIMYVTLYKSLVRPILEYCSLLWCPYRSYLSDQIEAVQRRFTRFFPSICHLPYKRRLSELNLLSLKARRLRYKLIFLYKMINGLTTLAPKDFFCFSSSSRHNVRKIVPVSSKRDCRRYFFFVDVVFYWNLMSTNDVTVSNVKHFKRNVESFLIRNDIW